VSSHTVTPPARVLRLLRRTWAPTPRLAHRLAVVGITTVLAVAGLAVPGAGALPTQASGKCPLDALKKAKDKQARRSQ
jgi:hypothetical protein